MSTDTGKEKLSIEPDTEGPGIGDSIRYSLDPSSNQTEMRGEGTRDNQSVGPEDDYPDIPDGNIPF